MNLNNGRKVFGIVGGMGPQASSEFLKTIYEHGRVEREQDFPTVLLYSDPSFPDRTEAFLAGREGPVLEQLVGVLEKLFDLGASKAVLCCVTIHHLIPRLPEALRGRIISLLDVVFDAAARTGKRYLMICSSGTRRLELFENHKDWRSFDDRIVMPEWRDQQTIHSELIYPIKKNPDLDRQVELLKSMLARYDADSFIAGCSEIHILAKRLGSAGGDCSAYSWVDPLDIIARQVAQGQW
nr:hypothetical protein [uncultured bacterium]